MPATHKPAGYTTVSPYLIVDGAARTIDFLTRVFNATELRRFPCHDREHHARRGADGVKDAGGTTWWIATKID